MTTTDIITLPMDKETLPHTVEEYLDSILPDLRNIMQRNNIIMSGSMAVYYYMLHNNLAPGFSPGDTDFFILSKDVSTEVEEKVVNLFKKIPPQNRSKTRHDYVLFMKRGQDSAIRRLDMLVTKEHHKIDLIRISDTFDSVVQYINESFDLDICKCWYDGKELYGPYQLLKNRHCELRTINVNTRPIMEPLKLVAYFNRIRSFVPTNTKCVCEREDGFRTLSRVIKYTQRGFTIDTTNLEMPKQVLEDYISKYLAILNLNLPVQMKVIFCHDDMTGETIEKINKALGGLS